MKNQTAANPAYALILLFLVNFPNFFDRAISAVALEPFRREFGLDETSLGLRGTSFTLIYVIGLILWSVMTGVTGIAWSLPGFGTIVTGALSDMFERNAMTASRALR